MKSQKGLIWTVTLATALGLVIAVSTLWPDAATTSVIVQGQDLESAAQAVHEVGGEITYELGIIQAVAARIPAAQRDLLEGRAGLRVYDDRSVEVAAKGGKYRIPDTYHHGFAKPD